MSEPQPDPQAESCAPLAPDAPPESVLVAAGEIGHVREMKRHLESQGIAAELAAMPEGKGSSWGTQLALAVAGAQAAEAAQAIKDLWGSHVDSESLERAGAAVDLDAEQASCPACGDAFKPSDLRCPSCGLRFG